MRSALAIRVAQNCWVSKYNIFCKNKITSASYRKELTLLIDFLLDWSGRSLNSDKVIWAAIDGQYKLSQKMLEFRDKFQFYVLWMF